MNKLYFMCHLPNGKPVYIGKANFTCVYENESRKLTEIRCGTVTVGVKETPEEVAAML